MELTADRDERLDRFLARVLPTHSRTKLAKLVEAGVVLVGGKPAKRSMRLELGMIVRLDTPAENAPHDLTPADIALDVVFEDDSLLVINKPRGLATHPAASLKAPSLVNALLARTHGLSNAGSFRPGIVHRLDKETTGLIVVAKTDSAHVALARQIAEKRAERRYVAVVVGDLEQERFSIDAPIARDHSNRLRMAAVTGGKAAVTHVKKLRRLDQGSLCALRLETGRTHQIRVHLRAIGHPVVGDSLYARLERSGGAMQLHAAFLAFDHPATGASVSFFQAPPPDFVGSEWVNLGDVEPF